MSSGADSNHLFQLQLIHLQRELTTLKQELLNDTQCVITAGTEQGRYSFTSSQTGFI